MNWYVYMVQCKDGSLYTGITNDLVKRVNTHNTNSSHGSRYVRSRRPATLVYHEIVVSKSDALKREAAIKRLTREEKIALFQQ